MNSGPDHPSSGGESPPVPAEASGDAATGDATGPGGEKVLPPVAHKTAQLIAAAAPSRNRSQATSGKGSARKWWTDSQKPVFIAVGLLVLLGWVGGLVIATWMWQRSPASCQNVENGSPNIAPVALPPQLNPGPPNIAFTAPADPNATTAEMGGGSRATLLVSLPVKTASTTGPGPSQSGNQSAPTSSTTVVVGSLAGNQSGAAATSSSAILVSHDLRLNVVKSPLVGSVASFNIPPDRYSAVVRPLGAHAVQLVFCLDRDQAYSGLNRLSKIGPGSYTGSVSLESVDGSTAATVPVTVKVQYQHILWLALLFGPLIVLGGGAFVHASGSGSKDNEALISGKGFVDLLIWLRDNPIPVATGLSAATLAYAANTVKNPTFGVNLPQAFFSLLGLTFAAYTAALAAGSAGYKKKGNQKSDKPDPSGAAVDVGTGS
jgi:hypothetical protein